MTKECLWDAASSSGVSSAPTEDGQLAFVGTCRDMCPEEERSERERHRLVHPFEFHKSRLIDNRRPSADRFRMVKEFRRPAAGKEVRMSELRPMPVLVHAVKYLLGDLLHELDGRPEGFFTMDAYDFIFDRLRAVRQDMVIQRLDGEGAIFIYEQTIAFLVLFGYKLCSNPAFVVKFNETHITECFGQLVSLYAQHEPHCLFLRRDKERKDGTTRTKSKGPQSSHQRRFVRNYALFHSMHALHALDKPDSVHNLLNRVPSRLHNKQPVSTTVAIAKAYHSGNYARFFKILNQEVQSPLLLAISMKHCVFVQMRALSVMRASYCGKNLSYPLDHLCQLLCFSSEDEATSLLSSLGVKTVDNRVIFVKTSGGSGGGGGSGANVPSGEEIDSVPKNKNFRFVDQLILRFPHFPLKS